MNPRIRIRTKISWIRNTVLKQAMMRYLWCRTGPSPRKLMAVGSGSSPWRISCCLVESVSPACQWVSLSVFSLLLFILFIVIFVTLRITYWTSSRFLHGNKFFAKIYRTLLKHGRGFGPAIQIISYQSVLFRAAKWKNFSGFISPNYGIPVFSNFRLYIYIFLLFDIWLCTVLWFLTGL